MRNEEKKNRLTHKITLLERELNVMRHTMHNLQSVILSNISHDIRTPMNAIVGFANLLADENMDVEERIDCIEHINNHSTELLVIIDNIIDASLLQCGSIKLLENECYINDILDEICATGSKSKRISQKNLRLNVKKGEGDDFFIIADDKRLIQIFNNLIDNALKFTNHGSIDIGYYKNNNKVTFFVRDTGSGLDSGNNDDIFKPFRTEAKAGGNGSARKGAGLGLAISKNLVELMGGEIWPESAPGTGTCFYFTLPVKRSSFIKTKLQQIGKISKQNIASII